MKMISFKYIVYVLRHHSSNRYLQIDRIDKERHWVDKNQTFDERTWTQNDADGCFMDDGDVMSSNVRTILASMPIFCGKKQ